MKPCRTPGVFAFFVALPVVFPALVCSSACPPETQPDRIRGSEYVRTDKYALSVSSASGAQGDIVAVTVSLESRLVPEGVLYSLHILLCHDPEVAELVGTPSYNEEFLSLLKFGVRFYPIREGADDPFPHQKGHGFWLWASLSGTAYARRFPSPIPLRIMTVYYRLIGSAGATGALEFCDGALDWGSAWGGRCTYNSIYSANPPPDDAKTSGWEYLSTVNVGGWLTVLPGPATNPDRPPELPEALVYPELPSAEEIDFWVAVSGTTAPPGAREVPVEVYAQAAVEYTGIVIPVDFDERFLRVSRVVLRIPLGVALKDNNDQNPGAGPEEGNVVVFSGYGIDNRRLAAEGERLHVATIYFDVLESSGVPVDATLSVVPITTRGIRHEAWIAVRHQAEWGEDTTWTRIAPQVTVNSVLAIRSEIATFLRGDANGDLTLDISDPVGTLRYLFQDGPRPQCWDAADANDDGELDISDPVRTLGYLFKGGPPLPPPSDAPGEDPTEDGMGCLYRA